MRPGHTLLAALLVAASAGPGFAAEPDQVLVLYNRDWTGDLPGTEPGQDSEEVARYYVARHTHPETGKRPYLLGLTCRHKETAPEGGHLSAIEVEEASRDNYYGVLCRRKSPPGAEKGRGAEPLLVSTHIEAEIPLAEYDWNTVTLKIGSADDEAKARIVYAEGESRIDRSSLRVDEQEAAGQEGKVRRLRVNAKRAGYDGDVWAWVSARGRGGGADLHHGRRYVDPEDLTFSWTGGDGVRDDKHYLEDIEQPVKAFLEDPNRAVEGRPLKDHILYIVICYGMPRIVARHGGIAQTAVAASRRDSGHLVSLCQRLETMHYRVESVRPPQPTPVRLQEADGPFRQWAAVSTLWWPLVGRRVQPYLHPAAYRTGRFRTEVPPPWPDPPHFTPERRRSMPYRFLYMCSRIDGPDPETAKGQVDAALYATRYLTPKIGSPPEGEWDGERALLESRDVAGAEELERLGLPGAGKSINFSAYFGRREGGGYLPGAVDWYVISANSVGGLQSHVTRTLRDHVTVTGGAARSYSGCPHTTTHGWWDSRVFYHYLFRGYDLGEAWLLSKYKVLWSTSFFGDPLYRPDLSRTRFDTSAPRLAGPEAVRIETFPAGDRYYAVLTAEVKSEVDDPELVTARVEYASEGQGEARGEAVDRAYRRRSRVILRPLEPDKKYTCRLVLTDPYLNAYDSDQGPRELTLRTGPAGSMNVAVGRKNPEVLMLGGPGRIDQPNEKRGEIEVLYAPPESGRATVLACGDLRLTVHDGLAEFNPGGGVEGRAEHTLEPGRAYRLRLRYRRWPVTREVWVVARDGTEFLLASDNRTPWRALRLRRRIRFAQSEEEGFVRHATLFSDARPGADVGVRRRLRFDPTAFDRADADAEGAR